MAMILGDIRYAARGLAMRGRLFRDDAEADRASLAGMAGWSAKA